MSPLRSWPVWLLMAALLCTARPARAAAGPELLIVTVDRLMLQDVLEQGGPNLRRLLDEGSVGLMTTRTAGARTPDKIYLTISAGEAMTSDPGSGRLIFSPDELVDGQRAADAYGVIYGRDPGTARVLHLGLAGLERANRLAFLPAHAGRLGQALLDAGRRLAVLGNADYGAVPNRAAAAILLDKLGRVEQGDVGAGMLVADWRAPGGWRTDYRALERAYDALSGATQVIQVDLGDLARIAAAGTTLSPAAASRQLRDALRRMDLFLGRLLRHERKPQRILIFAASPPPGRIAAGERLTPVILWGREIQPGLAYSASTRQAGIVTPLDLAATIAAMGGAAPGGVTVGRPIESRPGAVETLPGYYAALVHNYGQRPLLFSLYGYLLLAAALASLAVPMGRGNRGNEFPRLLVLGLAMTPGWLMALSLLPLGPIWLTVALVIAGALLAGWIMTACFKRVPLRLGAAGLGLAALILADVAIGSPLLRRSLLGYSPISGARFYGLGNEYLGVTLGAVILGGASLAASGMRRFRPVLAVLFLAAAVIIALPRYGANVGGGITALFGLGYTYFLLAEGRFGWREAGGLALGILALLGVLVFFDLVGRGSPSHLGQAILRARLGGGLTLGYIALGKLLMNLRIMSYTSWAWIMLGVLLTGPVFLSYPPRSIAGFIDRESPYFHAIRGMLATAAVGLLVNDSGVVVAATILIYLGLVLVYTVARPIPAAEGFCGQSDFR